MSVMAFGPSLVGRILSSMKNVVIERPVRLLPSPRQWGAVAGIALTGFLLAAVTLQFVRVDLDWQRATLSRYLMGPYGLLLRTMYCVLGLAIIGLALGLYAGLQRSARSAAPALLFVLAAFSLATVSIGDSYLPALAPDLHRFVHATAAQTAFLCVTTAMLLQAWRFRGDPGWRMRFPRAFAFAVLCFLLLWLHVLWPPAAGGGVQKLIILLVVLWLALHAYWLWRTPEI